MFPIVIGFLFVKRCFQPKSKKELLSNIVHAYLGTIFIFAASYYQCVLVGDLSDAVNKRESYRSQVIHRTEINSSFPLIAVANQRAFKGIKPRLFSGYDYPTSKLTFDFNGSSNPYIFYDFLSDNFEELSLEQIERIVKNGHPIADVVQYQGAHTSEIYLDCLYFSVACIATVGFGDISPNLWYTKLFSIAEIMLGIAMFVFAIGMLFSGWRAEKNN